ncbi:MAG: 2-amino-5-chlorophenol 1,6-dioxygenase subunit alpha [Pseudonocardiaceae bacterium]|nr:2-amino-5-chlorophenol 1,6-dioxygenase subunit alpha [Pseudonocardiaceae bacterium]
MADGVVAAALVPGLPHLLAGEPAPSWKGLAEAARTLGERLRSARVDTLLWMSTQWFTVLGHQFQVDPHPRGTRVDENWYGYDFGRADYDLRVDAELAQRWADETEAAGLQARRTRYDGFPIDTGTVVTAALLDPHRQASLAMVSCNLYAGAEAMERIGAAGARAAGILGRRVAVVAVSGLSSGLIQRWINPDEDAVDPGHDRWNRHVLDLLAAGRLDEVMRLREQYAAEAQVDSQLRALAFLAGTGALSGPAEVLEYGPVWGTGAAVIGWTD